MFCDLPRGRRRRLAHQPVQIGREKIVPQLCAETGAGFRGTSHEEISILTATEFSQVPQSSHSRVERPNPDTQTGTISPQCS